MMAPTSTTFDGSAHTMPVMKTVCVTVSPASLASAAKPTNELARIRPGSENAARTPRENQTRRSWTGSEGATGFSGIGVGD